MVQQMTIRPPDNLYKALKSIAHNRGSTMNQLILQILREWVEREQKKSRL